MSEQTETKRGRRGRGRVAIAIAVAALATASVLAACTTSVDGTATYEGAGTILGTDTGSVPTPSDATVTTESSESSTSTSTAPVPPDEVGYCKTAYAAVVSFLPEWDAAVAGGTNPTAEVRQKVATAINNSIDAAYPTVTQIKNTTVRPLFDQLLGTMQALSSDVANGNSADLDAYTDLTDQIQTSCSI